VNQRVTATVYAHALPGGDDLAAAAGESFQKEGKNPGKSPLTRKLAKRERRFRLYPIFCLEHSPYNRAIVRLEPCSSLLNIFQQLNRTLRHHEWHPKTGDADQ
jgi:hypothetical protein